MVPRRSYIIKPANDPFHGITYKIDVSWTESTELRKIQEILKWTRTIRAITLATFHEILKVCMKNLGKIWRHFGPLAGLHILYFYIDYI